MQKGFADSYLARYRCRYFSEPETYCPFDLVVVIPCYNEPQIGETVRSLFYCITDRLRVAVVVVVNSTEGASPESLAQNSDTVREMSLLKDSMDGSLSLHVLHFPNMPRKNGGVGWARKIGMDWAVAQFNHSGNRDGIIVSLDADAVVEPNYIIEIYSWFKRNPPLPAATVYFEHVVPDGDLSAELSRAVTFYELYMRYYRNALAYTGFPAAIYTVGSCFAARVDAYIAQGGMNRRQAGEDFYFLHKLAILGPIGEINSTTVYPSGRISDRVPFGTGPVVGRYIGGDKSLEETYPLTSFLVLEPFFKNIPAFFQCAGSPDYSSFHFDETFVRFLFEHDFPPKIHELAGNCSSLKVFTSRFFHLFNAFSVLKWLNYFELKTDRRSRLIDESGKLLAHLGVDNDKIPDDPKLMLNLFRQIDKRRTNH